MTKKIGLLGGTFDPPHIGHLIVAEEVRFQLQLDEVWFLPTNVPPLNGTAGSNNKHGKRMLPLALDHMETFRVDTIKLKRGGKSNTVVTCGVFSQGYLRASFSLT